jgi:transposase
VDDFIGPENPARAIDAFVEGLDLRALGFTVRDELDPGRASYHPGSLLKLYLWGYFAQVRSSRRLEDASQSNLNVIWLTGNLRPDHTTISRFRKSQAPALARIFSQFTTICLELGLYGRELIAIDGTFIKAVNSRSKSYTKAQLVALVDKIDSAAKHYLEQIEALDAEENQSDTGTRREDFSAKLQSIRQRKKDVDDLLKKSAANENGQVTLTDPDSRLLRKRGRTTVGYNVQASVDDKHHLVASCEVTQDGNDLGQLDSMAQKAKENLGLTPGSPLKALADTGYHCGSQLSACKSHNTEVIVPAPKRKTGKDSVYKVSDFVHQAAPPEAGPGTDSYLCPNGKTLNRKKDSIRPNNLIFRVYGASTADCRDCALKESCTKKGSRELRVSIHKEVIDEVQARVDNHPDATMQRASLVEHPFGTFKDWTGSRHLLTRGLPNVRAEVNTTFWSYNFKRALGIVGVTTLVEAMQPKGLGTGIT